MARAQCQYSEPTRIELVPDAETRFGTALAGAKENFPRVYDKE